MAGTSTVPATDGLVPARVEGAPPPVIFFPPSRLRGWVVCSGMASAAPDGTHVYSSVAAGAEGVGLPLIEAWPHEEHTACIT